MKLTMTPSSWRGIIPPMVTPLRDRDSLDEPGLERLIEHILRGGVHGLFILGTTGEAPSLSYRLRKEFIRRVIRQVADRVPVLVGITDTAIVECIDVARVAAEAGASGLVLSAPYYFPAGQAELLEYLQHLVPELPLPVFLYNMPSHTKLIFEPETVRRAMELPGVIGIKDSSANMVYFHQLLGLLPQRPEWRVLIGPEELLAESLLLGGHGGITGGANLHPSLYVKLYNAAMARDLEQVTSLHQQVLRLCGGLYQVGQHRSSVIKGIKCALACLGICDDFMAEPFHRFRAEQRARIEKTLGELSLNTPSNVSRDFASKKA